MTYQDNQLSMWQKFLSYFSGYPTWLVEGVFAVLAGFFVGFLAKNFGKPILYGTAVVIVAGYIFNYFGIIEFHLNHLQQMLGIVEIPTIDVAFANSVSWMSEHISLCIGAVVGFAIGWRVAS